LPFSASVRSMRVERNAGTRPNTAAVKSAIPAVN
jgi:hypothetical protein